MDDNTIINSKWMITRGQADAECAKYSETALLESEGYEQLISYISADLCQWIDEIVNKRSCASLAEMVMGIAITSFCVGFNAGQES